MIADCPFSCISFRIVAKYALFASLQASSYRSSQAAVVIRTPASRSPCSTFTTVLELTSPDPVPPFTVWRAPFPNSAASFMPVSGRQSLFSNKTMPCGAILLTRAIFRISRSETSFVNDA